MKIGKNSKVIANHIDIHESVEIGETGLFISELSKPDTELSSN